MRQEMCTARTRTLIIRSFTSCRGPSPLPPGTGGRPRSMPRPVGAAGRVAHERGGGAGRVVCLEAHGSVERDRRYSSLLHSASCTDLNCVQILGRSLGPTIESLATVIRRRKVCDTSPTKRARGCSWTLTALLEELGVVGVLFAVLAFFWMGANSKDFAPDWFVLIGMLFLALCALLVGRFLIEKEKDRAPTRLRWPPRGWPPC